MRVQSMVAEADAEADGQPMQRDGDEQVGPTEIEERNDGQNVKDHHHRGGDPVQR